MVIVSCNDSNVTAQRDDKEPKQNFPYDELTSEDFIRVLTIKPDGSARATACGRNRAEHPDATFTATCKLECVNIYQEPRPMYIAISYTWEHGTDTLPILINGSTFYVHRNVYDLFLKIQRAGDAMCIWIDAICINQQDRTQKAKEIRNIHRVFREARYVISWLWSPHKDIQSSLDNALHFINSAIDTNPDIAHNLISSIDNTKVRRSMRVVQQSVSSIRTGETPVGRDHNQTKSCQGIADVIDMCHHQYFARRWVVQEMLLASSNIIWTHSAKSTLGSLEVFRGRFPRSQWNWLAKLLGESPAGERQATKKEKQITSLSDALFQFESTECQLAHDKIFALVGLFETSRAHLDVDYNISVFHLACKTVAYVRAHEQLLSDQMMRFALRLCNDFGSHLKTDVQAADVEQWRDERVAVWCERCTLTLDMSGEPKAEHESLEARSRVLAMPSFEPRNLVPASWTSQGLVPISSVSVSCDSSQSRSEFVFELEQTLFTQPPRRESPVHASIFLSQIGQEGNVGHWSFYTCYGLAGVVLRHGDEVWRIRGSMSGLIVRMCDDKSLQVVGCAHLFKVQRDLPLAVDRMIHPQVAKGSFVEGEAENPSVVPVHLSIPTLIRMAQWVMPEIS